MESYFARGFRDGAWLGDRSAEDFLSLDPSAASSSVGTRVPRFNRGTRGKSDFSGDIVFPGCRGVSGDVVQIQNAREGSPVFVFFSGAGRML